MSEWGLYLGFIMSVLSIACVRVGVVISLKVVIVVIHNKGREGEEILFLLMSLNAMQTEEKK